MSKRGHATWLGLVLVGLLACGGGGESEGGGDGEESSGGEQDLSAFEGPITGDATAGAMVYANNCAGCHDAGAPNLREHGQHESAAAIRSLIRNGSGRMPAFNESTLSAADLENVMAHLQSEFGFFAN